MNSDERLDVDERGRIRNPGRIRDCVDIHAGDRVRIRQEDSRIVIEKATVDASAGYRRRAARAQRIDAEMQGVSTEANRELGDAPDWK